MILFLAIINLLLVNYSFCEDGKNSTMFLVHEELQPYNDAKESLRNLQVNFKCVDTVASCSGQGVCSSNNATCICDQDFATFPVDAPNQCNYKMKKQLVAFLCELFLGFGAGHFYTERYTDAGFKLAAFLFGIYIICLFPLSAKCISDKCDSDFLVVTVSCFYYLCAIGLAFWFIYDLVMFGMNKYMDGNGISLIPWGKPTKNF
jgi:hypothetical protein